MFAIKAGKKKYKLCSTNQEKDISEVKSNRLKRLLLICIYYQVIFVESFLKNFGIEHLMSIEPSKLEQECSRSTENSAYRVSSVPVRSNPNLVQVLDKCNQAREEFYSEIELFREWRKRKLPNKNSFLDETELETYNDLKNSRGKSCFFVVAGSLIPCNSLIAYLSTDINAFLSAAIFGGLLVGSDIYLGIKRHLKIQTIENNPKSEYFKKLAHYQALQERFTQDCRFPELIAHYRNSLESFHIQTCRDKRYRTETQSLQAESDVLGWFAKHYKAEIVNIAKKRSEVEIKVRPALKLKEGKPANIFGFYNLLEDMGHPLLLPERTG
tara:strand:+ start:939 stop:1916 length:978 start_codon:yes stop_codon:yes gene_type:complete